MKNKMDWEIAAVAISGLLAILKVNNTINIPWLWTLMPIMIILGWYVFWVGILILVYLFVLVLQIVDELTTQKKF